MKKQSMPFDGFDKLTAGKLRTFKAHYEKAEHALRRIRQAHCRQAQDIQSAL